MLKRKILILEFLLAIEQIINILKDLYVKKLESSKKSNDNPIFQTFIW
jgi:hypothetical protein